ncbi:hypothetical protein Hypma_001324 [Hypsizygus marmoreus]|uniref:Uncharacterized protein n=1 Tax=Hypsizygus marmoreus TaxID=39966 RepID=A0A369K2X9_HYPMA|nr:hypothetical protein Hypma_001324 [Hypsizygus marmoreus]
MADSIPTSVQTVDRPSEDRGGRCTRMLSKSHKQKRDASPDTVSVYLDSSVWASPPKNGDSKPIYACILPDYDFTDDEHYDVITDPLDLHDLDNAARFLKQWASRLRSPVYGPPQLSSASDCQTPVGVSALNGNQLERPEPAGIQQRFINPSPNSGSLVSSISAAEPDRILEHDPLLSHTRSYRQALLV